MPLYPPPPVTAQTVLQRMTAVYKKARSPDVRTEADQRLTMGRSSTLHQSSTIRYQANPPRLVKTNVDPLHGTQSFYGEGNLFTAFNVRKDSYAQKRVPGGLTGLGKAVDHETPQVLNPISFLISGATPVGLAGAQLTPNQRVNGKSAFVVRSHFRPDYLQSLTRRSGMPEFLKPVQSDVTLYVDAQTYLLLKSQVHIVWKGRALGARNRAVPVTVSMAGTENYTRQVLNTPLSEADMRFVPPRGTQRAPDLP